MPPTLFKHNQSHGYIGDAKKLCEFRIRQSVDGAKKPHISHIKSTQLVGRNPFSFRMGFTVSSSFLAFSIFCVILFCSEFQMSRIYATGVSNAFVQDAGIWWHGTDVQYVGSDMAAEQSTERLSSPNLSIPKQVSGSDPRPTVVIAESLNLAPKPFRKIFAKLLLQEILRGGIEHNSVVIEANRQSALRIVSMKNTLRSKAKYFDVPTWEADSVGNSNSGLTGVIPDVPDLELEAEMSGTYRSHVRSLASLGLLVPRGSFILTPTTEVSSARL